MMMVHKMMRGQRCSGRRVQQGAMKLSHQSLRAVLDGKKEREGPAASGREEGGKKKLARRRVNSE